MKVIDVSEFNGSINWEEVAKDCDGAIIRVGYRGYSKGTIVTDKRFSENIVNANKTGLKLGVYFVTQAITEVEARIEARYTTQLVKGFKLDLPIFIDTENGSPSGTGRADAGKLGVEKRTDIMRAFCSEIQNEGYAAGIYASEYWLNRLLNMSRLNNLFIWAAKYSINEPGLNWDAWQYTSKGKINGINGYVDISKWKDSDKTEKQKEKAKKKTIEEIAKEVINGKWGNGSIRVRKLKEAGYDPYKVQDKVNELLKAKKEENGVYYIVKNGDTLSAIAQKYSTSVKILVKLNNITDANKIYVGQKLRIR